MYFQLMLLTLHGSLFAHGTFGKLLKDLIAGINLTIYLYIFNYVD